MIVRCLDRWGSQYFEQILEPGQRYICLVKKEWTTNLKRNLGEGLAFQFRGFRGDYDVVVRRNGVPVQKESFVLSNNDTAIIIRITNSTGKYILSTAILLK